MNKDNAHLFLPLVQALADGKTIQYMHLIHGWIDMIEIGQGEATEYRIKPEPPKPREFEIGLHHELRKNDDTPCCISEPGGKLKTCTGEIIRVREIIEE